MTEAKLTRDIAWTMGSFVILAASGILINIVVAYLRGAEALGIFNQAYSVYIIASQIAAFGIHYSVLRSAAYHEREPQLQGRILLSGAIPALVAGILLAAVVVMAEPVFASLFSAPTARAISFAGFGLALFPLNKVLIGFLNGLRHMKAFAIFQAMRYILVAATATVVAASALAFEYASFCFLIAEATTVAAALLYIVANRLAPKPAIDPAWIGKHAVFGGKSLFAGMFGEINTRVDVLMLGLFLDDTAVGIYSFAAMLMDGLYHLLAMVRVNFNPYLVAATRDRDWPPAQDLLRRSQRLAPLVMGVLCLAVVLFYWIVTGYIVPERGLQAGLPTLIILLLSLTLVSCYVPFDNLLLTGGYPGFQTLQQFFAVATNVLLNVVLIPVMGIAGAAVGTGLSYVASVIVLIMLSRRFFGWNMLTNKVNS
ncbi:oligosaccharide flippase family protein [Devosia lacusdianchii]|uniref:oligosaccharide flippase family protein n=1 Tax=Devosia lacusdianchii TaxID=2917991 RepID=UPI001F069ED6|nr:oligosaccharide flippase family protein [Devosia sp. JXJ CY 41]